MGYPARDHDDSAAGAAFVMAALEDEDEPEPADEPEVPSSEPDVEDAHGQEPEPEPAPVAAPAAAHEKSQDMAGLLADVLAHAEDAIGLDVELTVAQYAEVYGIDSGAESIRRHLGSRIAAYCKLGKF